MIFLFFFYFVLRRRPRSSHQPPPHQCSAGAGSDKNDLQKIKLYQFVFYWKKYLLYRPVFVFVRAPPAVFAVVIVGTCIALTAQPGRFFTKLSLIVGEHETVVCMRRNEHRTAWRMTIWMCRLILMSGGEADFTLPARIFTQDLFYECSAGHDSWLPFSRCSLNQSSSRLGF